MRKIIATILALLMITATVAACNNSNTPAATPTPTATPAPDTTQETATPDSTTAGVDDGGDESIVAAAMKGGAPTLSPDAATRAEDAYAFIAALKEEASQYNSGAAKYRYTLNCFDPAASASGEFLYAWSDAVLIATEGDVYIDVGVSNAYCAGGTMAAMDDMIAGAIDFNWTLPCYFKGYMPLTLAIQNPSLKMKNNTIASYAMWDLYKNNADVQAEYADDGEVFFVWANNPSPLSYKGTKELTSVSEITGNIRGNNGPAQIFITLAGASVFGCPIGDVYTNVSTGVINYLVTDWHAISSFSLYDEGVLNYYLDTNIGCSAYSLMCNENIWDEIEANGYADAIKSVSGDFCLNIIGIWEAYEASGRANALSTGGIIYEPNADLAAELDELYTQVAEQWISENGPSAQAVYDEVVGYVAKYDAIYG